MTRKTTQPTSTNEKVRSSKEAAKCRSRSFTLAALITIAALTSVPALAQTGGVYDLTWNTIDSGGVMGSTGGDYELSGTIGQPEAGVIVGGEYAITGGFWSSAGDCGGIVSSNPANCSVDARRPYPPNNLGVPENYSSIALTFANSCNVGSAVPAEFTVACNPAGAPCPTISGVSTVSQVVTVNFSSVIPAGNWTCVKHTPSGAEVCLGSLPGDCSGNLFTAPADIIDLIDHLNGVRVPLLTDDHCDLDRSNLCVPADILTLIDLLNGANGFISWSGKTLPACPNRP